MHIPELTQGREIRFEIAPPSRGTHAAGSGCRFFLFPLIESVGHARLTAEIAFPAPALVLQAPRPEPAPETIRVSIMTDF